MNTLAKPMRLSGFIPKLLALLFFAEASPLMAQPGALDDEGRKHGTWVKHHEKTGKPIYEAQFEHGEAVGVTRRYYEDGSLKAELTHRGGGVDDALIYHPNESLMARGIYRDEKKDSIWLFYDENGILRLEEEYKKGEKHGQSRTYFSDGSISEKAVYQDGVKHGAWEQYHPDGQLKLKAYVEEGIRYEGNFEQYYPNGRIELKGKYADGKRHGSWYQHHEDGSIEVIVVYRWGKVESEHPQNGTFEKYYEDDILRSRYTYKNGEKHGPFEEYYQKGEWRTEEVSDDFGNTRPVQRLYGTQLLRKGKYKNDELHGELTRYSPEGKIVEKAIYEHGKKVN